MRLTRVIRNKKIVNVINMDKVEFILLTKAIPQVLSNPMRPVFLVEANGEKDGILLVLDDYFFDIGDGDCGGDCTAKGCLIKPYIDAHIKKWNIKSRKPVKRKKRRKKTGEKRFKINIE